MRILKLKLTNFIPYFGDDNEIVLAEESRGNKKVTLNIGPTGNGKTSISKAVMFCLFGEQYAAQWETMINDLAIEVATQARKSLAKIAVEMEVEIEGDTYIIHRSGEYDSSIGKRESDTKLSVRTNGETIREPPESFINEKFPPVELMEYFIFDADDMLGLFEKNREKTIKDHINKIVGVETLDNMSESLKGVISLYETEISDIRSKSPGISKEVLNQETRKKSGKTAAIEELNRKIEQLGIKKKELFPKGRVAPEQMRLKVIMDKQREAEAEINQLNKEFEENGDLISNTPLLFLNEILSKSVQVLNKTETTKTEFEGAINTLKSTLEGKYGGIFIDESEVMLIRGGAQLKDTQLEKTEKLKLGEGSGIKAEALLELGNAIELALMTKKEFLAIKDKFIAARKRLTDARMLMKQMGETEKNLELKAKIDKFLGYDNEIAEYQQVLEETNFQLTKIEDGIRELTKDQKTTADVDNQIKQIQEKAEKAAYMKKVTDSTKKLFLQELLKEVNQNATEFFREVVRKDDPRLNAIVVDSNYTLNVKNQKGETLDPSTISKGNMQVALMAFFFGLSKYLKNKLPYIIDDPLIRLDVGHDKRLVIQLCKSDQQLIMHMIRERNILATASLGSVLISILRIGSIGGGKRINPLES